MNETLLDALMRALDQCRQYSRASEEAPMLIFWPDPERQWDSVLPFLRVQMPQVLTLGTWNNDLRTGPAEWVRCLLSRTGMEVDWPDNVPPVVYLPGIAREDLRAVDECPEALAPIAGLQYRGRIWSQQNGRDWTVRAFLASKHGGVGLEIADDSETHAALFRALGELVNLPIETLRGRHLSAKDFDDLWLRDSERHFLRWLDAPVEFAANQPPDKWRAFVKKSTKEYNIDLVRDGPIAAAQKLCAGDSAKWQTLWQRFSEAVPAYPGVLRRLQAVEPPPQITFDARARYPKLNSALEEQLRKHLRAMHDLAAGEARTSVLQLEGKHGPRRSWPWASIPTGDTALAHALEHLVVIARETESPLVGDTPDAMAETWVRTAWRADLAALRACASVQREADLLAVHTALRAIYQPWLDETAHRFQNAVATHGFPGYRDDAMLPLSVGQGEILFFADGLRYDVSRWLCDVLESRGCVVSRGTRWIGMPSVTATSKYAASPVVNELVGTAHGKDFCPMVRSTGKPITADVFFTMLSEAGYTVLEGEATGNPGDRGYMEYGNLDHEGHAVQGRLASRVEEHVLALADRIERLLGAGWKRLRVVTDHGWLLVPGGLPKCALDTHVSEDKWGRCAVLKSTAVDSQNMPTLHWRWGTNVQIVAAPGIAVFYAGSDYAHGGLSLHECLTPDLWVSKGVTRSAPTGVVIGWRSMRCVVRVASGFERLRVDVRKKANDANTSIVANVHAVAADGTATVLVKDADISGEAAHVVLLDSTGEVVYSEAQTIGG